MCLWGRERLTWGSAAVELGSSQELGFHLGFHPSGTSSSPGKDGSCSKLSVRTRTSRKGSLKWGEYFSSVDTVEAWTASNLTLLVLGKPWKGRFPQTRFRSSWLFLNLGMLSAVISCLTSPLLILTDVYPSGIAPKVCRCVSLLHVLSSPSQIVTKINFGSFWSWIGEVSLHETKKGDTIMFTSLSHAWLSTWNVPCLQGASRLGLSTCLLPGSPHPPPFNPSLENGA